MSDNNATPRREFAVLASLALVGAIGAACLANPGEAKAVTYGIETRTDVWWYGGNTCNNSVTRPDMYDARFTVTAWPMYCGNHTTDFDFVTPGSWYGVDPNIGDANAVECEVVNTYTGEILAYGYATAGNGVEVDCLRWWA